MVRPTTFNKTPLWILVAVCGGFMMIASTFVEFEQGFLIGIGLLLCGIGRWIDEKETGYFWPPTVVGGILSVGGIGFAAFGIYRLIIH